MVNPWAYFSCILCRKAPSHSTVQGDGGILAGVQSHFDLFPSLSNFISVEFPDMAFRETSELFAAFPVHGEGKYPHPFPEELMASIISSVALHHAPVRPCIAPEFTPCCAVVIWFVVHCSFSSYSEISSQMAFSISS